MIVVDWASQQMVSWVRKLSMLYRSVYHHVYDIVHGLGLKKILMISILMRQAQQSFMIALLILSSLIPP
jgi:hypothetical protein